VNKKRFNDLVANPSALLLDLPDYNVGHTDCNLLQALGGVATPARYSDNSSIAASLAFSSTMEETNANHFS
jgi:hypothetical protein